jgi:hypothetical protein
LAIIINLRTGCARAFHQAQAQPCSIRPFGSFPSTPSRQPDLKCLARQAPRVNRMKLLSTVASTHKKFLVSHFASEERRESTFSSKAASGCWSVFSMQLTYNDARGRRHHPGTKHSEVSLRRGRLIKARTWHASSKCPSPQHRPRFKCGHESINIRKRRIISPA